MGEAALATQGSTRLRPRVPAKGLYVAAAGVALVAMLAALWIGDGRPVAPPPGLPDEGRLTAWVLPMVRLVADLAGVLSVGLLTCAAVLLPSRKGELGATGLRCTRAGSWAGLSWSLLVLVELLLFGSELVGVPVSGLTDSTALSFLLNVDLGRALLVQAFVALLVAGAARFTVTSLGAALVLAAALAAWIPQALVGHAAGSDDHTAAVTSLAVHLIGMALWCGGLVALVTVVALDRKRFGSALRRFSALALWCVIAVAVSGAVNAALRMESPSQLLTTSYGGIVLLKLVALTVLIGFGFWHRSQMAHRLDDARARAIVGYASVEVLIMAGVIGLGVALSRTPPPISDERFPLSDPARVILGYDLPPAPTAAGLLWEQARPDLLFLALALALGALYVVGLRALRRRGDAWPWGRTAAWFAGVVILAAVTNAGVGSYAEFMFSAHMIQHMVLNMIVPIFLVLGAPITLALRAMPSGAEEREWLLRVLHSRFIAVVSHPLVATAIFISSFYVLYFTEIFPALMRSHWGHVLMNVHFLLAGALFFWVLIGIDPGPRRPPYVLRLLLLVVAMPMHAFFSVAVMSSTTVLGEAYFASIQRPYLTDLLADQRLGGGVGWALGEVPIALVLIVLFVQWVRSDEQQARRFDREADRAEQGDGRARDELADYNAYLASLSKRDRN